MYLSLFYGTVYTVPMVGKINQKSANLKFVKSKEYTKLSIIIYNIFYKIFSLATNI